MRPGQTRQGRHRKIGSWLSIPRGNSRNPKFCPIYWQATVISGYSWAEHLSTPTCPLEFSLLELTLEGWGQLLTVITYLPPPSLQVSWHLAIQGSSVWFIAGAGGGCLQTWGLLVTSFYYA